MKKTELKGSTQSHSNQQAQNDKKGNSQSTKSNDANLPTEVTSFNVEGKLVATNTYDECPDPIKMVIHTTAAEQVTLYYESTGTNQTRQTITVLKASQAKREGDEQVFEYEWTPPHHYVYEVSAEAKGVSFTASSSVYRVRFR